MEIDFAVLETHIESRLRRLESRYRLALSATVSAKARYLAIIDDPAATAAAKVLARNHWRSLEATKRALAARMGEVEALDRAALAL